MTSTMRVYLRRARALHLEAGLTPRWTAADVRQILKGTANSYRPAPGSPTRDRIPVTPFILFKIKEGLSKDSTMTMADKRLFWLFCTWAYVGSFRSSDILAEQVGGYRPTSTLMTNHVTWRTEVINNKSISYLVVRVPEVIPKFHPADPKLYTSAQGGSGVKVSGASGTPPPAPRDVLLSSPSLQEMGRPTGRSGPRAPSVWQWWETPDWGKGQPVSQEPAQGRGGLHQAAGPGTQLQGRGDKCPGKGRSFQGSHDVTGTPSYIENSFIVCSKLGEMEQRGV